MGTMNCHRQEVYWRSLFRVRQTPIPAVSAVANRQGRSDRWFTELFGESQGGLHWKNFIDTIKMKSVRRFTTIPLLSGYDISKKNLIKKLGRNQSADDDIDCGDMVVPKPSWRSFSRTELVAATDNFNSEKLIGKGGHAEVYKGCLPDGQVVAVKRITKNTEKKEEDRVSSYLTELGIIAHINHPNAAKLIGFSADGGLHLVVQFSPHGSLASLLHGANESLAWKIRFKVALGVAEGLQYLHCECPRRIIHRDITASNILLAEDYEPQISDFGLAKWLPEKWLTPYCPSHRGDFRIHGSRIFHAWNCG
ncbi:hypothetical protein HYC85_001657 [Camellia sinensis]|uniref:non-specific serine/threonine protein kinase n=1 Tax=Camellia sinensis TaxID=4442 RepID=A0A7J7I8F9_CAMSI|nr:hypothetical protein HYC85_001657 [Camellia sinensis]